MTPLTVRPEAAESTRAGHPGDAAVDGHTGPNDRRAGPTVRRGVARAGSRMNDSVRLRMKFGLTPSRLHQTSNSFAGFAGTRPAIVDGQVGVPGA